MVMEGRLQGALKEGFMRIPAVNRTNPLHDIQRNLIEIGRLQEKNILGDTGEPCL